jgi:ABC-type sugar transport system substrate-binding protein
MMSSSFLIGRTARRWLRAALLTAVTVGIGLMPTAPVQAETKRIIGLVGFACGFNDFAKSMCQGFAAGGKEIGSDYAVEVKTGVDYADQPSFNNLIETSLQLNPAGIIVFPGGPAAQVPVLKRACAKGIKIIIIDNPVDGLGDCQSGYVAADHYGLGASLGEWLKAHPASTKEVGIVTLPPGQYASNDARVEGFKKAAEAAGYQIAATVVTDLTLDKTRTLVTNMLAGHPHISAVMSANGAMGSGTAQAISDPDITQLTLDGEGDSLKRLLAGARRADALQDPYNLARLAVVNMAKLLHGESIPATIHTQARLLDATNVKDYLAETGKELN